MEFSPLVAGISTVAAALALKYVCSAPSTDDAPIDAQYDYVIVGGGSAGAVVARRLCDQGFKVLLLEAGANNKTKSYMGFEQAMPLASGILQLGTIDWKYKTTPQKNTSSMMENRVSFWPRGKTLGGCSSINYMQYVRGHPEDYDSWNVKGWGYKELLPYFLRSEDHHLPNLPKPALHGKGGPLHVTLVTPHPLSKIFVAAGAEAGLPTVADYNDPDSMFGMGFSQVTVSPNGKRASTANFVNPSPSSLLHVRTFAQVARVIWDRSGPEPRAIGVEYVRTGGKLMGREIKKVLATKEVVLSGGAVGSPHLLLLSGIGDQKELADAGIDCVHHLPAVGKNMTDHLMALVEYESKIPSITSKDENLPNLLRYLVMGTGAFTSTGLEVTGFFKTGVRPDLQAPDAQIHFIATGMDPAELTKQQAEGKASNFNFDYSKLELDHTAPYRMTALPILLHPKSVGYVRIRSADPFDHPLIEPNYLSHPDDMKTLVEACKKADSIFQQKAFLGVRGRALNNEKIPIPFDRFSQPDQYWAEVITRRAMTVYHPVGTCKIGNADDANRVVDERLRVVGVRGLRVCDASIIPFTPSGNTNAPAIVVGERGAALIAEDARAPRL